MKGFWPVPEVIFWVYKTSSWYRIFVSLRHYVWLSISVLSTPTNSISCCSHFGILTISGVNLFLLHVPVVYYWKVARVLVQLAKSNDNGNMRAISCFYYPSSITLCSCECLHKNPIDWKNPRLGPPDGISTLFLLRLLQCIKFPWYNDDFIDTFVCLLFNTSWFVQRL